MTEELKPGMAFYDGCGHIVRLKHKADDSPDDWIVGVMVNGKFDLEGRRSPAQLLHRATQHDEIIEPPKHHYFVSWKMHNDGMTASGCHDIKLDQPWRSGTGNEVSDHIKQEYNLPVRPVITFFSKIDP